MRWATFELNGSERVGVVMQGRDGDAIHALEPGKTLVDVIAGGAEALRVAGQHAMATPDLVVALADVRLRAPIPHPPSVRDSLCFLEHMRNCQVAADRGRVLADRWYEIPAFYFACPATVVGPYDDVEIAPGSTWFDFELEIAAVIGRGGANLSVQQAQEAIVGYTIYNDWSARDLQLKESVLAIGQAKGKDCALTLGPFLVTPDELADYQRGDRLALNVTARVNDRIVGSGNTAGMDWSFAEVISYASRGVELRPGDVFGSGTVPTCTLIEHLRIADPASFQGWLHAGDTVTLEVEGLGTTRQVVRPAPAVHSLASRVNPDAPPKKPRINPAPSRIPFTKGLHQVGDRVWAWLGPDGGFGFSNSGLIAGDGSSLLVDTLFDLALTREMLAAIGPITKNSPLRQAVLTHANGDHTYGNQLLGKEVRIIAAEATSEEMHHEMPPEMLQATLLIDLGPVVSPYFRELFAPFDFSGITLRTPDETFTRRTVLDVGGREVRVDDLGPAHTAADCVIHVPDAGVLFAGDLLFIGGAPLVWSGPISTWIAACDTMIATGADTFVPGHGPVTDVDGVRKVRDYLAFVIETAENAYRSGTSFTEAAEGVDLGEFRDWLDSERIVANIYRHYTFLDPDTPVLEAIELFALQAQWRAKHGD